MFNFVLSYETQFLHKNFKLIQLRNNNIMPICHVIENHGQNKNTL